MKELPWYQRKVDLHLKLFPGTSEDDSGLLNAARMEVVCFEYYFRCRMGYMQ